MDNEIFLFDTNIFIEPFNRYYQFDIAPGFWELLEIYIHNGRIVILDKVADEINKKNDKLSEWFSNIDNNLFIKYEENDIMKKYGEILQYVQENPCYTQSALYSWANDNIADPFLIATACVKDCVLVTHEVINENLNENQPSKKIKIPNIAQEFKVKTVNLFYVMKQLHFKLVR